MSSRSSFLYKQDISSCHMLSSISPSWEISMCRLYRSVLSISLKVLYNYAGRPSLPGDLLFSKDFIAFSISATVISWSYSSLFLGEIFFLTLQVRVDCIFFVLWCFLRTLRVATLKSATFKIEIKLFIRLTLVITTNHQRAMIDFNMLLEIVFFAHRVVLKKF